MNRFDTLISLVGIAGCTTVIIIAAWLDPDPRGYGTHQQLNLPPCGFLLEHHYPCISCGMTTAFSAMAHAQFGLALRANPFGCVLFLVTLFLPFWCADSIRWRKDPLRFTFSPRGRFLLPVGAALLLINWAVMATLYRLSH